MNNAERKIHSTAPLIASNPQFSCPSVTQERGLTTSQRHKSFGQSANSRSDKYGFRMKLLIIALLRREYLLNVFMLVSERSSLQFTPIKVKKKKEKKKRKNGLRRKNRDDNNVHFYGAEGGGGGGGANKQTKQKTQPQQDTEREDPSDRHRRTRKRKPLIRKSQHRIPVTMRVKRTRP